MLTFNAMSSNLENNSPFSLRSYQEEALEVIYNKLMEKNRVLMQAATGAGKTIIFTELIKRFITQYPAMRIGILAHRQELIYQAYDKLEMVWPESREQVGLACAGIGKVDIAKKVVIGSIQTLARRAQTDPFNLLIIDEAHRIPSISEGGQYHSLITECEKLNPTVRVLGVTATPFRLNYGYIYGKKCKPGKLNIFPDLDYSITMNTLIEKGYLSKIRIKHPVDINSDLKQIRMLNGEYRTDDLEDLLIRVTHLKSSLEAYEKYGENRQHVLVFAVTIKHAEALTGIFSKAGYNAAYVHSETTNRERRNTLRYFEIGNIQFLINVGVLTEGWDSPKVNLIMLCRPTKSAGLYVQMVGRGSRVTKDKENVLILDMVNNFREHGHPSNPEVKYPKKPPSPEPALLIKTCPNCFEVLNISIKICPFCGHEFCTDAPEVNKSPVMEEVYFNKYGEKVMYQKRFKSKNQKNEPFVAVSAKIAAVSMTPHIIRSEKNYGKRMGNLTFTLEKAPNEYIKIKYFIDVENAIGALAYNRFKRVWDFLKTGGTYPGTIAEAIKGIQNADPPAWVHYYENENGYFCLAELENVKKEKSC